MTIFNELLLELQTEDFFGRFSEKLKKYKNNNKIYINFSDKLLDFSFKGSIKIRGHNDPTGVYGYPIKYYLEHQSDPLYASSLQNLNVLEDISKNKLVIQRDWDFNTVEEGIKYLREKFPDNPNILKNFEKRWNYWGKQPKSKIQRKIWEAITTDVTNKPLSPAKQSFQFLKYGWDAIEDVGLTDETSVITYDEVEPQIIFFKRSAFKIIETLENKKIGWEVGDEKIKRILSKISYIITSSVGNKPISTEFDQKLKRIELKYSKFKFASIQIFNSEKILGMQIKVILLFNFKEFEKTWSEKTSLNEIKKEIEDWIKINGKYEIQQ
jgi:hypothetical protein